MSKLKNITHDLYKVADIKYTKYLIKDCSSKKKEYIPDKSKEDAVNIKNIGYVSLYYNQNPLIYVTTPVMVCLFGLDKKTKQMSLQFTNLESDSEMKSFFDFIENVEVNNMKHLGIDGDNYDKYINQIRYDKQNTYDPNLSVKVPFVNNRYDMDIYSDDYDLINIENICNFTKMRCDIYIDKIWKWNDVFTCKWKVKVIHLV
jgi:hypothetical protein